MINITVMLPMAATKDIKVYSKTTKADSSYVNNRTEDELDIFVGFFLFFLFVAGSSFQKKKKREN